MNNIIAYARARLARLAIATARESLNTAIFYTNGHPLVDGQTVRVFVGMRAELERILDDELKYPVSALEADLRRRLK